MSRRVTHVAACLALLLVGCSNGLSPAVIAYRHQLEGMAVSPDRTSIAFIYNNGRRMLYTLSLPERTASKVIDLEDLPGATPLSLTPSASDACATIVEHQDGDYSTFRLADVNWLSGDQLVVASAGFYAVGLNGKPLWKLERAGLAAACPDTTKGRGSFWPKYVEVSPSGQKLVTSNGFNFSPRGAVYPVIAPNLSASGVARVTDSQSFGSEDQLAFIDRCLEDDCEGGRRVMTMSLTSGEATEIKMRFSGEPYEVAWNRDNGLLAVLQTRGGFVSGVGSTSIVTLSIVSTDGKIVAQRELGRFVTDVSWTENGKLYLVEEAGSSYTHRISVYDYRTDLLETLFEANTLPKGDLVPSYGA